MENKKELVVYRDEDADLAHLKGKNVVVLGYGNQGRSQSLNMRDSGLSVTVASIRDSSAEKAEADGFTVIPVDGCARQADILMMLIPDEVQRQIYDEKLAQDMGPGKTLCFGHGYNFNFGAISPPPEVDVVLVAPRMIGVGVRTLFEKGKGAPSYVAIGQDGSGHAKETMLAITKAIGSTRVGAMEVTFEQETIIDLFLEQTLMPIFTRTMTWVFDILTEEAGIDPGLVTVEMYGSGEMAEVFQACAAEGFWKQLQFHSRTAQFGELSNKDQVLPDSVRKTMVEKLEHIRSGGFAREWSEDEKAGFPRYNALIEEIGKHPINEAESEIAKRVEFAH